MEKYNKIINSSINGQWKQSLDQYKALKRNEKLDFIDYLEINIEDCQEFIIYLLKSTI